MIKDVLLALLIVVLGGYIVFFDKAQEQPVGGAGQDYYNTQYFRNASVQGGVFAVATSAAAYTLTDAQMSNASVISVTAGSPAAALALTLPASSTWTGLSSIGDSQTWVVDNLHTAAATTTTITAGAGVDIDGTTANDDVLNGGVAGRLTCWRLADSNVRCMVEEMVDAG